MDFSIVQEYEVVNSVLRGNPAGKSVEQIAAFLSVSPTNVYKWGQNPENSGSGIPKKYIIPFCTITEDNRLLDWYAHQLDCHLAPNVNASRRGRSLLQGLLYLDGVRGRFADELREALADGRIDPGERAILSHRLAELIAEVRNISNMINQEGIA